mgnify:CR=1 FL=1
MKGIKFTVDVEKLKNCFYVADEYKENPEKLLPIRGTKGSAGYDLINPYDCDINIDSPGLYILDTFIKIEVPENIVAKMYVRSSIGIEKGIVLANGTGIIDSDFKDTIKIPLVKNRISVISQSFVDTINNKKPKICKGDRIVQIVFTKYFTTEDDNTKEERTGGIGSTGK